jgi:hypothetical protein
MYSSEGARCFREMYLNQKLSKAGDSTFWIGILFNPDYGDVIVLQTAVLFLNCTVLQTRITHPELGITAVINFGDGPYPTTPNVLRNYK